MGENPIATFPRPVQLKKALYALDFMVVTEMFLTETAELADVVLPAASFVEKEGTFTNFEGRVQHLRQAIEPSGESLSDGDIILRLAEKMGSPMPYTSCQQITEEIEEMIPFYRHISYSGAGSSGMDWDDVGRESRQTRRLYKGLFPSGFGRFSSVEYKPPADATDNDYPFTLIVGSSRYHFGSGSRSGHSSRLQRYCTPLTLEIGTNDAGKHDIKEGDKVRITSRYGEIEVAATIGNTVSEGLLYLPVTSFVIPVYSLFNDSINGQAKAPALKSCAVRLERTTDDG